MHAGIALTKKTNWMYLLVYQNLLAYLNSQLEYFINRAREKFNVDLTDDNYENTPAYIELTDDEKYKRDIEIKNAAQNSLLSRQPGGIGPKSKKISPKSKKISPKSNKTKHIIY